MEDKSKKFCYTYSAPSEGERREIEEIRRRYELPEASEGKFETLKRLDRKVRRIPLALACILGIAGLLVFGLGLTMTLEWRMILWGALVCAAGCAVMGLNVFIYKLLYRRLKEKYGGEILRLSAELLPPKEH